MKLEEERGDVDDDFCLNGNESHEELFCCHQIQSQKIDFVPLKFDFPWLENVEHLTVFTRKQEIKARERENCVESFDFLIHGDFL